MRGCICHRACFAAKILPGVNYCGSTRGCKDCLSFVVFRFFALRASFRFHETICVSLTNNNSFLVAHLQPWGLHILLTINIFYWLVTKTNAPLATAVVAGTTRVPSGDDHLAKAKQKQPRMQ